MNNYTVSLFCRRDHWHYEVTVEAANLDDAKKQAKRDYADKHTRIVNVARS